MTTAWLAPAKLNLFLYITGRRSDGYHNLQTLFQFIDYCDTLFITPRKYDNFIQVKTAISGVIPEKNLIYIAAKRLQAYTQCPLGAEITIEKKIPIGGGLGGASSDAATTLLALNYLWNCQLNQQQLLDIGKELGADVPVFILGHAAFAQGIGDQLQPVSPPEKWYLVVKPDIHISTADIFNDPLLKRDTQSLELSKLLLSPYTNDCETIVRKKYVSVEYTINWLLQYASPRLTGTGACVFAEFTTQENAQNILNSVPHGFQAFVAKGMNISPLHRQFRERCKTID